MIKKIIFVLLLFLLLISVASSKPSNKISSIYYESNQTIVVQRNNISVANIHLITVDTDLMTMSEIYEVTPKASFTVKSNNFSARAEKFVGYNISSATWYWLNTTNITTIIDDYGIINRSRIERSADNTTNITVYYNSTEIVGHHNFTELQSIWLPMPASISVVNGKLYYIKLIYTKVAEIGDVRILTIPSFFDVETPQFTWWNTSWLYRADNIISNGTRPYQILLNISNATGTNNATYVFCNGHCNSNFSDVRFTLDNTTVIPYWFENTTTGKVWVNLTSNGTINMYYGNTLETISTSDGNTTFIFFDDFSGATVDTTNKWNINAGSPSIVNGKLQIFSGGPEYLRSKQKYVPLGNKGVRLMYRATIISSGNINSESGFGDSTGSTQIGDGSNAIFVNLYQTSAYWRTKDTGSLTTFTLEAQPTVGTEYDYIYTWELNSLSVKEYLGNLIKVDTTDTAKIPSVGLNITFDNGNNFFSTEVDFDNVIITPFVTASQPVWSVWGIENTQTLPITCNWCKFVNVSIYNNGTAKYYNPSGTLEGNLTLKFFDSEGLDNSITYNLTGDNLTSKVFNISSNNKSTRITFILKNFNPSVNFSIQRYNSTNNIKIADQWILSNASGFITYNATMFNGSEYTVITTTTTSNPVTVIIGVSTIIIGGVIYYLRRTRKV